MALQNPMSNERRWLAAMLVGAPPPPIAEDRAEALLACAIEEGVVALVHRQLAEDPDVPAALRDAFATAAREAAIPSLLREAECRRVLALLREAEIPVLLLKGSALAWWLYPAAYLRECADIDLLFPSRAQAEEAVRLMATHGYALSQTPNMLSYVLVCRREVCSMHIELDMHGRLVDAPMFADLFGFETLRSASTSLPGLAPGARGLGAVHAFMHACMHRAINLHQGVGDSLKWLYDLHLLAQRLTASEWSALQCQCRALALSGICVAGITAAAELYGDAAPEDVLQSLREAANRESLDVRRLHDWKYIQARNLAALPSLRARVRWLWQRLFPPLGELQKLYGADHSRGSLWMQRAQRAIRRLRS